MDAIVVYAMLKKLINATNTGIVGVRPDPNNPNGLIFELGNGQLINVVLPLGNPVTDARVVNNDIELTFKDGSTKLINLPIGNLVSDIRNVNDILQVETKDGNVQNVPLNIGNSVTDVAKVNDDLEITFRDNSKKQIPLVAPFKWGIF